MRLNMISMGRVLVTWGRLTALDNEKIHPSIDRLVDVFKSHIAPVPPSGSLLGLCLSLSLIATLAVLVIDFSFERH